MKKCKSQIEWELNKSTYTEMVKYRFKSRTVVSMVFMIEDKRLHVEFNPYENGNSRLTKVKLSALKRFFITRGSHPNNITHRELSNKLIGVG